MFLFEFGQSDRSIAEGGAPSPGSIIIWQQQILSYFVRGLSKPKKTGMKKRPFKEYLTSGGVLGNHLTGCDIAN